MTKAAATTSAPASRSSFSAASAVPPVAIRSSTSMIRSPADTASACISKVSTPYSSAYSIVTVLCGSLPFLRSGTKPAASWWAMAAPKMKPRASIPATLAIRSPAKGWTISSTARRKAAASLSRVVMSRNMIPGLG